jgi:hypothetical protein
MLPTVIAKYAARLMGFSISEWVVMTLRIMFVVGLLFALLLMVDIYEEQFRGSKLAFAGVLAAACFCGPAALWQVLHGWFGTAFPAEPLRLSLAVAFVGGIVLSVGLLLIASFRSTRA